MGCCCSSEENNSIEDEPNSRTRLLQDPVGNSYQVNTSSNEYGSTYGNSAPLKSDDHSALYKVLQQIANKVIDVGALDCQALEEHEYAERSKVYAQSINKINIPQSLLRKRKPMLLADVPGSEKILTAPPISPADYNMVVAASRKVSAALNSMKIAHQEDLVVPFGKG